MRTVIFSSLILLSLNACQTVKNKSVSTAIRDSHLIEKRDDGRFDVKCEDGSTEIRSDIQIQNNDICKKAIACQTIGEILSRFRTAVPPLTPFGLPVENMNDRFCIHTVPSSEQGLANLTIAISDIGGTIATAYPNGSRFDESQKACASLTLAGKKWTVPSSSHQRANPKATDSRQSSESIGAYFVKLGDTTSWWSASSDSTFKGDAVAFRGFQVLRQNGSMDNAKSIIVSKGASLSVRCIVSQN